MSIVQVLLSSSLAVIIALGGMQLILQSKKSEDSLRASLGKINLQQDLKRIISEETICTQKMNFDPNNADISTGSAKLFLNLNGTNISTDNEQAKSLYNLSNVEILYTDIQHVDTLPNGNDLYEGKVSIASDKKSMTFGGLQNNTIEAGELMVEVDSSLNFQSCYSELSVAGNCSLMGGTYDPNSKPKCVVPPACPEGQILVSQGQNKPGKCQDPPVKVVRVPMHIKVSKKAKEDPCSVNKDICNMYVKELGRQPDEYGIEYWNATHHGSKDTPPVSLSDIQSHIYNSPEAQRYRASQR